MHEQIRQAEANDDALRRAFVRSRGCHLHVHGSRSHRCDVETDPGSSVWCATARSTSSCGMESKKALISRSMTQSATQHRCRDIATASAQTGRVDSRTSQGGTGFHQRLEHHLRDRLRDAIGTVGMPSGRVPPCPSDLDETHGRRKIRAGRHSIPELVEIALQVLLERRQRLTVHAGCAAVRLDRWYASQTSCLGMSYGFASDMGSSLAGWPSVFSDNRAPSLHPHYRASSLLTNVRPCASHRYSAPRGSTTWTSPLASRRQVPTFRTGASRGLTPPSRRTPLGQ